MDRVKRFAEIYEASAGPLTLTTHLDFQSSDRCCSLVHRLWVRNIINYVLLRWRTVNDNFIMWKNYAT